MTNGHSTTRRSNWNPFESVERHFSERVKPDFDESRRATMRWFYAEAKLAGAACQPTLDSGRRLLVAVAAALGFALFGSMFVAALIAVALVTAFPGDEMSVVALASATILLVGIFLFSICRSTARTFNKEMMGVIPKIIGEEIHDYKQ